MMTTNERRAAWRQYAVADLRSAGTADSAIASANKLLAAEDDRFGKPDDVLELEERCERLTHELARSRGTYEAMMAAQDEARAHALEQETRAANAEMALEDTRKAWSYQVEQCRVREAQLAAGVPVGALKDVLAYAKRCEQAHMAASNHGEALNYGDIANGLRAIIAAAEQRAAAAKPAEGGETGGGS